MIVRHNVIKLIVMCVSLLTTINQQQLQSHRQSSMDVKYTTRWNPSTLRGYAPACKGYSNTILRILNELKGTQPLFKRIKLISCQVYLCLRETAVRVSLGPLILSHFKSILDKRNRSIHCFIKIVQNRLKMAFTRA